MNWVHFFIDIAGAVLAHFVKQPEHVEKAKETLGFVNGIVDSLDKEPPTPQS